MLENIKIVLIETSHSGNIGSVARAMKTMGLTQLYLVSPKLEQALALEPQAMALAANATDILQQAHVVGNLLDAIGDCELVIGTSARSRHLPHNLIEPRACAKLALDHLRQNQARPSKVAILFGRERVGLTNEELLQCHYHLVIPTNPDYSSLNLAMAVQLISYELRLAWLDTPSAPTVAHHLSEQPSPQALANNAEVEYFLAHSERLYQQLGFIQNQGGMQKLRRLYYRARLEKNELNILHGMLTAVERKLKAQG